MPKGFQKGNRDYKKRKRESPGRPTREQAAKKESLRQAIEREREAQALPIARRYIEMGLADPATMRHIVSQVIPPIEKVEHSGQIGVKSWVVDIDPALEKKKK